MSELHLSARLMAAHFHLWLCSENVCFGSLADIRARTGHVLFTPKNGRWAVHPSQHLAIGL